MQNDIFNAIRKATSMTEEQRINKSLPLLRELIEIATSERTELQLLPDGYIAVTLGSETEKINIKGDNALSMIKDVFNHI